MPDVGAEVLVWARPKAHVILVLGEGVYVGNVWFNAAHHPVVRFKNGTEATIHYQGVTLSERNAALKTIENFKGTTLSWNLQDFLNGKLPSDDEIRLANPAAAEAAQLAAPQPKTATDKLLAMKSEIERLEKKKVVYQMAMKEADDAIAGFRSEMATLKSSVLKELESIDAPSPVAIMQQVPVRIVEHVDTVVVDDEDAYQAALED